MEQTQVHGVLSLYGYEKPCFSEEEISKLLKMCKENSEENLSSLSLSLFHSFQAELRRSETLTYCYQIFSTTDAFVLALSDPAATELDARDIVKLPDIIANVSHGQLDLEVWRRRITRTIMLYRCLVASLGLNCSTLPVLVETLCFNSGYVESVMETLFLDCLANPFESTNAHLGSIIEKVNKSRLQFIIKPVIKHGKSSSDLVTVLGFTLPSLCPEAFQKLLFSRQAFPAGIHEKLVHYLCKCLPVNELLLWLDKSLTLWGDPVIAKTNVTGEIMHYTKISLLLFLYGNPVDLLKKKSCVIEKLVRGLPHHFNSTDGRTILLAKFFSELITESLKYYEDKSHPLSKELEIPEDPLCRQLLMELQNCEDSQIFWFMPLPSTNIQNVIERNDIVPTAEVESDDDDSDLEPIETLDPPLKCNIRYIRNFLEGFPEMKSYEEVREAFLAIPTVIKHQLAYEHSQLGKDLLNLLFQWENEFEDAQLDDHRKTSLVMVLTTKLDGNLDYFCQMFHREQIQPYRKNLILDVLSKVSKNANLKELQTICNSVFRHLLITNETIEKQDVIVRIPFILFLSRIICLMPELLLTEETVVSYLNALSSLKRVDSATQQTICYALNNVMLAVGDKKLAATNVQMSIRDTRDWLLAIQAE